MVANPRIVSLVSPNGRYIRHVGSPKRVPNPNPSHTTHEMMSTLSSKHHVYIYLNLTLLVQCALLFAIVSKTIPCFTQTKLVLLSFFRIHQ